MKKYLILIFFIKNRTEGKRKKFSTLLMLLTPFILAFFVSNQAFGQASITYSTAGSFSWTCPAGVTSVTAECWGGGGKGGRVNIGGTAGVGGGGGGGAYAKKIFTVIPGTSYPVYVGSGSTTTAAGGDSYFISNTDILAKGGNSVADNTTGGATGGLSSSCIGTTRYSGGNGANGSPTSYGGGGGSSAGTGASGVDGSSSSGGTAPTGGGNGGNGATSNGPGFNGVTPGGAGGGARKGGGTANNDGGAGATGSVRLSYTCPGYSLTSVTAVSPISACDGTSVVTLNSSALNLPAGTYTISYNRSLPNATGLTATMTVSSAGTGSFTATGLTTSGTCTITITNLSSGSGSPCSSAISSNNTVAVTVNPAGISGVKTIGPSGNYTSITASLAAMASCGISGPVSFALQPDYLSTVETFPINIPAISGASATNTITIYPSVAGLTISSNNSTGTLFLNGSDYFIIDGRVNLSGSSNLTIQNTTTTGYTILLNNGATYNTIRYCKIQGRNRTVSTSPTEGVIWFGSGAAPGNSNNTIDNCDLGPDASITPVVLIYSNASGGTNNSNNTVSNCLIHDYYYDGYESSGINCNIGNTRWTVTGNSFYHTSTITPSSGAFFGAFDCFSGDGHIFSNNYIGGSGPLCTGTTIINGTANNMFNAVYFSSGLDVTNTCTISNNTINNINFTTTPATDGSFAYIPVLLLDGKTDVSGNVIGSATGTGGITVNVNGNTHYSITSGIYCDNSTGGSITNNTIGSITINGLGTGTGVVNFYGIYVDPLSPHSITGNSIGSLTTASSIQTNSTSAVPIRFRGIYFWPYGGTMTASANTISNISLNCSHSSSFLNAIEVFSTTGTAVITGNTIRDLTSASASTYTDGSAAVSGIVVTNSGNQHTVSQNQIYNLKSTHTSADNSVNGIYCYYGTDLDRNMIYNLSLATSSTAGSSAVNGMQIDVTPDNATIKNNIIRLGFDASGNPVTLGTCFAGIWDLSGTNNYYNNSIYIGGSGAVNTPINTACIYSEQAGTRTLRNNILCNERLGTSDQHFALILRNGTATSSYNCLYRPGGSDNSLVFRSPNLYRDLVQWQGAGFDANSVSNEPGFVDEIGVTPNLHLRPSSGTCSNNGTTLAAVTNDIDGDTRSATPDIGADEYTFAGLVWNGNTSTAWNTSSNWTINTTPKKADVILIPSGRPRYPLITSAYDAGSYHTTIESGASITVGPNAKLDITGTITNNAGVDGIVIQSTALGTGSLLHSTTLVNGTIQRYTTGSKDPLLKMYHCVSVPMDESNNSLSGLFYHSYLLYFDESENNWVGMGSPTETPLDERRGYFIYFVFNSDTTYQFPGLMKAGSFTPLVTSHVTGPSDNLHGWSLVPNPYPSAIDWNAASGWTKTGIDNAVYIWNPALGTYAEYVGGSGTKGGSRYIQVGQSFFIHANTTSPSFNMNNSVRLHNSTAFLKNTADSPANELRISIENNAGFTDEIIVKFNEFATTEFDCEWDAYNLPGLDEVPDLSTVLPDGLNLSINTLPFVVGTRVLPIHLSENANGQMLFSASGFESFVTIPQVYLVDNLLQRTIKLPDQPEYAFTFEQGQEDRFHLVFTDVTSYSNPDIGEWMIYKSFNKINMIIPEIEGSVALVSVYDITGRIVSNETISFYGVSQINAPEQRGVYIVKIVSGKKVFSGKILIE